jgi:diaminopimelate epimerase
MALVPFTKMHGLGNDFVMLDCLDEMLVPEDVLSDFSQAVCDHHFGVGGDGTILILRDNANGEAEGGEAYRMRMFNPDGSESEMCGNGIRCFAKYLYDAGKLGPGKVPVATLQGLQHVEISDGGVRGARDLDVRVDMGSPRLTRSQIPMAPYEGNGFDHRVVDEVLKVGEQEVRITAVSMGNPHVVIFVDDVESVALKELGFAIEHHEVFPQRTNVHFVQVMGTHKLWMRSWERGAGDTLACGTGACSVTVAAALNGRLPADNRKALVHLPGGDLDIEWAQNDHVYMTGPATTVFSGTLDTQNLNLD